MSKKRKGPEKGILTNQMDTNSTGFDKFQAKLLNRSRERSIEQKRNVELLALKYQIEEYLQSDQKEIKLAGAFLRQYLKTLQIKQTKFANYIGLKPSNLSKLLNGERPINYDLALILGKIFNISPMLWIEIQAKNELNRLEKAKDNKYYNYSLKDLISERRNVV
ncbi:MAG: HigA family addiction module antitoxin [Bacteroidota bacterium]